MLDDNDAAKLAAEADKLVLALRHIGLYEGIGQTVRPAPFALERPVLILDLVVGDNAFRAKVQDPAAHDTDMSFAPIEEMFNDQETTDIVDRLRRGQWDD